MDGTRRWRARIALGALSIAMCALPALAQTGARQRVSKQPPPTPTAPAEPKEPPAVQGGVTGLFPRWAASFETQVAAMPAFDDDMAFVALKGGPLVALDLKDGKPRWRAELASDFTPAVGSGRVFIVADGAIVALDAATGKALWHTPLPGALAAALYWDTGWLVASTDGGDLAAFRGEDGQLVWRTVVGAPLGARPVPADDALYAPLTDGRIVSVELATGKKRWEYKLEGHITGLAIVDQEVIAGTTNNRFVSIGLARGNYLRWWRVGADPVGAATADAKHIYFVALDNVLRAVDRKNGNLRWMKTLPSRPSGGPLLVEDVVLVPFVSTALSAFSALDGKPVLDFSAAGELAGPPHLRTGGSPLAAKLVTTSREGQLQGFSQSIEPVPAPLIVLPGAKVGS